MSAVSPDGVCSSDALEIRAQLQRILKSKAFQQSHRRQKFLQYLVDETLAGRADRLKGYAIAVEVFERPATFDPLVDPIVRVEAGRLRDKLREYYAADGRHDTVIIELPKGGYAPLINFRANPADAPDHLDHAPSVLTDGPDTQRSRHVLRLSLTNWITAGLALLLLAGTMVGLSRQNDARKLPELPSIAVLPFDNIGNDAKWQRFADGMTEDIIADLSQARDFVVIARNSTAMYRGKPVDIRKIGQDLNVRYVVEGSLQPVGTDIRVTAQLIDTVSGRHVWSERYDRHADDLFAVQDNLTQRIASTLISFQGAVAQAERSRVKRQPPASLSAYDTYLLGVEAKHKVTPESLAEAERLLRRAIEIDPKLARAYSALANVKYYLIDLGLAPSVDDAVREMAAAGAKAVELDPNDGLSHQALGMAYGYQGKIEQSLAELNRAEALAPSNADLLLVVGWSMPALGQSGRAVELADRALILNPHYPDWYNQGLSIVYLFGRQFEKAIKYRRLVKEPVAIDFAVIAIAQAHLGLNAGARANALKVASLDPSWTAERYLSETGGYPEQAAELFVDGAQKAGLNACVPDRELSKIQNFVPVPSCEHSRAVKSTPHPDTIKEPEPISTNRPN